MFKSLTLSFVFTLVSFPLLIDPAHAMFGGPFTTGASALGYLVCRDAAELDGVKTGPEAAGCILLTFDPIGEDVTNISLSVTFDPNKFEAVPEPFYFGDFSESGAFFP